MFVRVLFVSLLNSYYTGTHRNFHTRTSYIYASIFTPLLNLNHYKGQASSPSWENVSYSWNGTPLLFFFGLAKIHGFFGSYVEKFVEILASKGGTFDKGVGFHKPAHCSSLNRGDLMKGQFVNTFFLIDKIRQSNKWNLRSFRLHLHLYDRFSWLKRHGNYTERYNDQADAS